MDVGQGTAVVVQVKDKTLVYDTGPKFTESFDAGGAILVPYLYSQRISHVDTLVVSHDDMDHSGGMKSFLEKITAGKILLSDTSTYTSDVSSEAMPGNCHQQSSWVWYGVSFEFLPVPVTPYASDNNKSCVLLISYQQHSILLPGDIESRVEHQLLDENKIPHNLTLLLAAHHGSRTSSSVRFVNLTRPEYVIYSTGYRNQHRHPHPLVQERFQSWQSKELNTADSGAIVFEWRSSDSMHITEYRKAKRRYWFQ